MTVAWDVGAPGAFDSQPLVCPGRYNFPQGAIYRLKLSNIPGRPAVELYPTLGGRSDDAANRGLPGPQRHSGAVHRRRLRPGVDRQFRDQGDLSARSGVPGAGLGRRGDAGEHAAGSGRGPDRRGRSPRGDPGDRAVGQQGSANARPHGCKRAEWPPRRTNAPWTASKGPGGPHADGRCRWADIRRCP